MAIRAVIFDIGGVIEYTPRTGWQAKWDERLPVKLETALEQLQEMGRDGSLGTCTEDEWLAGLCGITGMDGTQADAFMRDLWQEYLGELNDELADYFIKLRPRYQTAFLSNSFVGARRKEEARYHFSQMTDLIIYSHEVGLAKPDPRIYDLTCRCLGVQPDEAVFLDDVEANVATAREAGLHAIRFQNTAQAIAEIEACLQRFASDSD